MSVTGISGRMLRRVFRAETIDGQEVSTAMSLVVNHASSVEDQDAWASDVLRQFVDPKSDQNLLDHAKPRRAFIAAVKAEIAFHAPVRRPVSQTKAEVQTNKGILQTLERLLSRLREKYPDEDALKC